jgi:hypothetical protein
MKKFFLTILILLIFFLSIFYHAFLYTPKFDIKYQDIKSIKLGMDVNEVLTILNSKFKLEPKGLNQHLIDHPKKVKKFANYLVDKNSLDIKSNLLKYFNDTSDFCCFACTEDIIFKFKNFDLHKTSKNTLGNRTEIYLSFYSNYKLNSIRVYNRTIESMSIFMYELGYKERILPIEYDLNKSNEYDYQDTTKIYFSEDIKRMKNTFK